MTTERQLQRLRESISQMTLSLEVFMEPRVQPSVDDCETLQQQLYTLQEQLAVYKHNKTQKELAPFFDLHSKVSEKEMPVQKEKTEPVLPPVEFKTETAKEEVVSPSVNVAPVVEQTELKQTVPPVQPTPVPPAQPVHNYAPKKMEIPLNDKFRFINDLFKQNQLEYTIAVEQLNTISSWSESEQYLNSLKNIYGWDDQQDVVKRLFFLAKTRF